MACLGLIFLVLVVVLATWRVVIVFNGELMSLHGLSVFELGTLEQCLDMPRQAIIDTADLFCPGPPGAIMRPSRFFVQ